MSINTKHDGLTNVDANYLAVISFVPFLYTKEFQLGPAMWVNGCPHGRGIPYFTSPKFVSYHYFHQPARLHIALFMRHPLQAQSGSFPGHSTSLT